MRLFIGLVACLLSISAIAAPVTASWDHNGQSVDGFRLRYECPTQVGNVPASAAARSLTFDAPAGETCTASMVAFNSYGDSARSNTVSFVAGPPSAPGAVTNLQIAWREHGAGKMGSIVFNGSNAYAMRTSRLLTAYAFSYFAWVKLDASANMTSGNYCAFSQGVSSSIDNVFAFGVEDLGGDSDLDAAAWARSNVWNRAASTAAIADNVWMAFGGTWTSTTSRAAYVNGADKGTDATGTTVNMGIQNRFGVGGRFRNTISGHWLGKQAHIAFWSVALTDGEHAALAAGALPSSIQSGNLLAYYPGTVIDISGTDYLEDVSGNGNHLELFGGWSYDAADSPPVGGGTDISGTLEGISLSTFPSAIASDRAIGAGTESISISTSGAAIALDRDIDIGLESMLLDAFPASVSADRSIAGVQESIQLSTFAAGLSLGLNVSSEQISLGTFLSVISSDRAIVGTLESLLLQASPASISTGANIAVQTGQITIQTLPAAISLDVELSAQLQQIVLSGLSAQIGLAKNIEVGLESLTITPFGATVRLDTGISARLEALTLATFAAVIESAIPSIQVPGLEYTIAGDRAHYTLPVDRLHFTFRS